MKCYANIANWHICNNHYVHLTRLAYVYEERSLFDNLFNVVIYMTSKNITEEL